MMSLLHVRTLLLKLHLHVLTINGMFVRVKQGHLMSAFYQMIICSFTFVQVFV